MQIILKAWTANFVKATELFGLKVSFNKTNITSPHEKCKNSEWHNSYEKIKLTNLIQVPMKLFMFTVL